MSAAAIVPVLLAGAYIPALQGGRHCFTSVTAARVFTCYMKAIFTRPYHLYTIPGIYFFAGAYVKKAIKVLYDRKKRHTVHIIMGAVVATLLLIKK